MSLATSTIGSIDHRLSFHFYDVATQKVKLSDGVTAKKSFIE
jgi:hypothetical protein